MAKNPDLLIEIRREEILDAFLRLFEVKPFSDINVKVIGEETRFTRTTIYNYFKNIDEIFVCAYQKEYVLWAEDLRALLEGNEKLSAAEFAGAIAGSLSRHERMLRFSLENFHEREMNSRREFVFSHKRAFNDVVNLFHDCLVKFFPERSEADIVRTLYQFFPFMHGMYRYLNFIPVQKEARDAVNIILKESSIYELTYSMVVQMLK